MKFIDYESIRTILVVEDEPSISRLCHRALTGKGFEVDTAANGRIAQLMVDKKSYTLCLIDIRTPEMNGIELFSWLGDRYPEMTKRVIFTTGDVLRGNTVHFIKQRDMPFLPKPFTPSELQTIVNNVLEHIS